MVDRDVDSILIDIKSKIKNNKENYENLLYFVAIELSKIQTSLDDRIFDSLTNKISSKYYSKQETKDLLKKKLEYQKQESIQEEKNLGFESQTVNNQTIFDSNPIKKQILNSMEKNKNLFEISDQTLHFSKKHLSLISRIFYLQITQNYLQALKQYFTNDLIEKQTKFNFAIDEGLKNLIKTFHEFEKKQAISINELNNYSNESTKWIQNNKKEQDLTKSNLERLKKEQDLTKSNLERLKKEQDLTKNELQNYENQAKQNFDKKLHELEIKINEKNNEVKELLINKDLNTTEYLLSKIAELDKKITDNTK